MFDHVCDVFMYR